MDEESPKSTRRSIIMLRIFAILALVGILLLSLFAAKLPIRQEELIALGYLGVLAITAISGASIGIPVAVVPAVVVLNAAHAYSPIITALVGGLGATLGEFSGYLAGRSGNVMLHEQLQHYHRVASLIKKTGALTILVLAWVPNPLFDVVGIVAGLSRYSPVKFAGLCFIGKTAKWLSLILLAQILSPWPL